MRRVFLMFAIVLTVIACNTQSNNNSSGCSNIIEKDFDYSELIELIDVKTGWDIIDKYSDQGICTVEVTIRNISNKSISKDLSLKYRFMDENSIIEESTKTIHYKNTDSPWDENLNKKFRLCGYNVSPNLSKNKTISIEIFDGNNNLLWSGNLSNTMLNKPL